MDFHDTFKELLSKLLADDCTSEEQEELARLCLEDPKRFKILRDELEFVELIRIADDWEPVGSATGFARRIGKRIAGEMPGFDDLADTLALSLESNDHAEIEELAHHCALSDENAESLRRRLEWDDLLGQAASPARSEDHFIDALVTRMWAEQEQDPFVDETCSRIIQLHPEAAVQEERTIPSNLLSFGTWITAAAAVLTLGFYLWFPGKEAAPVAQLASATDDVAWAEGSGKGAQNGFLPGRYQLETGVVKLRFRNGAEMTVEGPAEFEIRGEHEAFVHRGLAVIDQAETIAGGGSPFVLESNGLKLAEKTQTVGVDARSERATEAVVFNGGAEVCVPKQSDCRNLYAYEAVRVDLNREKVFDIPYKPDVFARSWEVIAGVERNSGSVRIGMPGEAPETGKKSGEVNVFVENSRFVPETDIEVDQLDPGQFADANGGGVGRRLRVGGELRSYLLEMNPVDSEKRTGGIEASVTFSNQVVGVIFSSDRLEQSDSQVGANMTGLTGDFSQARGLDAAADDLEKDEILLSDDGRTVNLRLHGGGGDRLDHVRVLVALK